MEKFYIINLDKDKDRYTRIHNEIIENNVGIPIRIPAIYGKNLSKKDRKKVCSKIYSKIGSASAIGCSLSHIKAWKTMIKNKDKYAIILEDDAILHKNFKEYYDKIKHQIPEDFYITYLGCYGIADINKEYDFSNTVLKLITKYTKKVNKISENVYTPAIPLALHGYILSRKGAEYLLKRIRKDKIKTHIDFQILKYIYKVPSYATHPQLIQQKDVNITTSNNVKNNYPVLINKILDNIKDKFEVPLSYKVSIAQFEIAGYPVNFYTLVAIFIGIITSYYKIKPDALMNYILIYHLPEWFLTNFSCIDTGLITIGIIFFFYWFSRIMINY